MENYLLGKLSEQYGKKNKLLLYKNSYNLGMWRLSFFNDNNLIKFGSIKFYSNIQKDINSYKYKIVFLGYFLEENNEKVYTNTIAFQDMINHIKVIADNFKDHAIILRMKIINNGDTKKIMDICKNIENFFLCADYSQEKISYRLCKDSDLIISLQTSLAEECLAYGKKVILINELFPISNICESIYPKIFHFAISKSPLETLKLAKSCFKNNKFINATYFKS